MIDKGEVKKSINRICEETGFQLYDWKLRRKKNAHDLVVYITKPDGVSLDDCELFSRKLGDDLDMRDVIETRYYLEVSSPGLERSLHTLEHFQGAVGEFIKVTFEEDDHESRTARGKLVSVQDNMLILETEDDEEVLANMAAVQKAKTIFHWPATPSSKTKKK